MATRDLDPLVGNGVISLEMYPDIKEESTPRTASKDQQDNIFAEILYDGIRQNGTNKYSLFVGYFADIDSRGHQYGAYDKKTLSAVKNKTEKFREYASCRMS
jgi:hypothetical protein